MTPTSIFPDWLEAIRLLGTFLIWIILGLQVWSLHWSFRQYRLWQKAEDERQRRWTETMGDAGKLREEAYHLRAQAEVALAQLRRLYLEAQPEDPT